MGKAAAAENRLVTQEAQPSEDLAEIVAGLSRPQKTLSPKFFYDQTGSQLFDRITELPEYYPTRTELGIMREHIDAIAEAIGPLASLIEFGSGSSLKVRLLLERLDDLAVYVPVDISQEHLVQAASELSADFPDLEIIPVAADFTREFDLPHPRIEPRRNVVYFPGSTIGNFMPDAALSLLRVMRAEARDGGALLIGVDLKKDVAILENAYNDAAGVTAEFNLNMLTRINTEFDADFDLSAFRHRAVYNPRFGRIEMHLVSTKDQTVHVAGHAFEFARDEWILSECSHKYTVDEFGALAARAGFRMTRAWTDPDRLFAVLFCESC